MKEIIQPYLGKEIGVNLDNTRKVEPVTVDSIDEDYFSVSRKKDANVYHIPFASVVKTIANDNGVVIGSFFEHKKSYLLVVRLGSIVNFVY